MIIVQIIQYNVNLLQLRQRFWCVSPCSLQFRTNVAHTSVYPSFVTKWTVSRWWKLKWVNKCSFLVLVTYYQNRSRCSFVLSISKQANGIKPNQLVINPNTTKLFGLTKMGQVRTTPQLVDKISLLNPKVYSKLFTNNKTKSPSLDAKRARDIKSCSLALLSAKHPLNKYLNKKHNQVKFEHFRAKVIFS